VVVMAIMLLLLFKELGEEEREQAEKLMKY
jgi:hypothetical protein